MTTGPGAAGSSTGGTISTGRCAWSRTPEETLPSSALFTPPRPREPDDDRRRGVLLGKLEQGGPSLGTAAGGDGHRVEAGLLCEVGAARGDGLRLARVLGVELLGGLPHRAAQVVEVGVKEELGERVADVDDDGTARREQLSGAANRGFGLLGSVEADQDGAALVLHGFQARFAWIRRLPADPPARLRANYGLAVALRHMATLGQAELARLLAVGRALVSELDLEAVLEQVLETARDLTVRALRGAGDPRRGQARARALPDGRHGRGGPAHDRPAAARPRGARRADPQPEAAAPARRGRASAARTGSRPGTRR